MNDGRLNHQLAIRISDDDLSRLDILKKRITIASRNAIARSALRLGIEILEADPTRAVRDEAEETPSPKRRRR